MSVLNEYPLIELKETFSLCTIILTTNKNMNLYDWEKYLSSIKFCIYDVKVR